MDPSKQIHLQRRAKHPSEQKTATEDSEENIGDTTIPIAKPVSTLEQDLRAALLLNVNNTQPNKNPDPRNSGDGELKIIAVKEAIEKISEHWIENEVPKLFPDVSSLKTRQETTIDRMVEQTEWPLERIEEARDHFITHLEHLPEKITKTHKEARKIVHLRHQEKYSSPTFEQAMIVNRDASQHAQTLTEENKNRDESDPLLIEIDTYRLVDQDDEKPISKMVPKTPYPCLGSQSTPPLLPWYGVMSCCCGKTHGEKKTTARTELCEHEIAAIIEQQNNNLPTDINPRLTRLVYPDAYTRVTNILNN